MRVDLPKPLFPDNNKTFGNFFFSYNKYKNLKSLLNPKRFNEFFALKKDGEVI